MQDTKSLEKVRRSRSAGVVQKKLSSKRTLLRDRIFGELSTLEEEGITLWYRGKDNGYTHLPRILPMIVNIIDSLTKGKPAGQTYLALWFRTSDEMIIDVTDEAALAYESGFHSERRVTTWQQRMAVLAEHGFIKAHKVGNRYQYALLIHPVYVIEKLRKKGQIQEEMYNVYLHRLYEVGGLK